MADSFSRGRAMAAALVSISGLPSLAAESVVSMICVCGDGAAPVLKPIDSNVSAAIARSQRQRKNRRDCEWPELNDIKVDPKRSGRGRKAVSGILCAHGRPIVLHPSTPISHSQFIQS